MAITSIGDLLDRTTKLEDRLQQRYAAIRDTTADEGVRLLTYYLAKHSRRLEKALSEFGNRRVNRIRDIKLKYDVDFDPKQTFRVLEVPPEEVRGPELLNAVVAHDAGLIDLYRKVIEQPLGDDARALFESLIRVEERDIVMHKKMIAMNYF